MNYLAHIHLSGDNDEVLIGNFIADFIRNKEVAELSKTNKTGVLLHRHIDAYTDIHPTVRKVTKIFRPTQRKYAPVVSDIIFDYLLVKNWDKFSKVELKKFKKASYLRLVNNSKGLPPKAYKKVVSLCSGDFISSYESLDGISYVFSRMDKRSKFTSNFANAREVLVDQEKELNKLFLEFYPQLIKQCKLFMKGYIKK